MGSGTGVAWLIHGARGNQCEQAEGLLCLDGQCSLSRSTEPAWGGLRRETNTFRLDQTSNDWSVKKRGRAQ